MYRKRTSINIINGCQGKDREEVMKNMAKFNDRELALLFLEVMIQPDGRFGDNLLCTANDIIVAVEAARKMQEELLEIQRRLRNN